MSPRNEILGAAPFQARRHPGRLLLPDKHAILDGGARAMDVSALRPLRFAEGAAIPELHLL